MPDYAWFVFLGLSGFFILAGVVAVILGKIEERNYYASITSRPDLREFIERTPEQPEPGAVRVGGWIAIAIGLVIIGVGAAFRFLG